VDPKGNNGTLGTFVGVFTPSILTILGIILFLRLGYVVGNGGLRNALLMIGLATAVTSLTSISLAAISTNIEVRGGGDYYLISRTLGIEFGGAIGIVLFLAQSVSIAFYAIGFGEAIAAVANLDGALPVQLIAAAAVLALFVLAWLGADAASKFQFVVMALLAAALVSFYVGAFSHLEAGALSGKWAQPAGGPGFWVLFAIFFPAVTGFTQGVSMSGDLRSPSKSLPIGTFAAVGLSTVVYVSVAILLAGTATLAALASDNSALRSTAFLPPLIDAGVIAATLSSAMASFLGAPRILQSLASDRIFPTLDVFAKGHGTTSNPRRAVVLSLVIALATISLGSLNVVAPVVSMFFLISYGLLNYATYYEAHAGSPSFRPRFRYFHRRLSLLGALASFGAMVAINFVAGAVALLVLLGIYTYLGRRAQPERWADASHSHYFKRAKESIRLMSGETESARNWRPQVLAFSADSARRERLMRLAAWLEGSSGLSAVVEIIQGSGAIKRREREERQESLKAEADALGVDVSLVVLAPDAPEALPIVAQAYGLGPLRANTALFGLAEAAGPERMADYIQILREMVRLQINVIAVTTDAGRWDSMESVTAKHRRIDVWWKGDDSSRLALLMAYLVTRTEDWSRCKIRVVTVAGPDDDRAQLATHLEQMLDEVRISASTHIIEVATQESVAAVCADASLVMVPARLHRNEILDPLDADLYTLLEQLPLSAIVVAANPVDLVAGPESGGHSAITAAEERVEATEARLKRLEQQLTKVDGQVAELRAEVEHDGSDEAEARLDAAEAKQAMFSRRVLKARAAHDSAKRDLALVIEHGPAT
jgi:amino acid transporter